MNFHFIVLIFLFFLMHLLIISMYEYLCMYLQLSWSTYTYYLTSIGISLVFTTLFINCFLQILSFSSNVWLSKWTDDASAVTPEGTQDTNKRDYYLSIYMLLGLSKCEGTNLSLWLTRGLDYGIVFFLFPPSQVLQSQLALLSFGSDAVLLQKLYMK